MKPPTPKRLVLLVVALACGLVVPPLPSASAGQALKYRFSGGGWGHGIGMSQYGARGFADRGASYTDILRHYYQGTSLATFPPPNDGANQGVIRVGLLQNQTETPVTATGRFRFTHPGISGGSVETGVGETWRVGVDSSSRFVLKRPDGTTHSTLANSPPLYVDFEPYGSMLRFPAIGHRYRYGRGELNVYSTSNGPRLRAILVLGFEQYLYGLGEMPSSWHMEALKAQAVAGRTYALEKANRLGQRRGDCNCAVHRTTIDQAYIGYEKEDPAKNGTAAPRWPEAVDATRGQVATYQGNPIQAFYHSTSGGHTEHNENVWGGNPIAYLRGVSDPHESSPFSHWEVTLTPEELTSRLSSRAATNVGTVQSIEVVSPRGISGRVTRVSDGQGGVRITGSSRTVHVSGDAVRSALGLRSTLFWIERIIRHPPGTTVSVPGDPAVWWLDNQGRRIPFTSMTSLGAQGIRGSEIVPVAREELNTYAPPGLPFPNGSLIAAPTGTVFFVSDGRKRPFPNASTFESMGYRWDAILGASGNELAQLPTGPVMSSGTQHPNGTLVQAGGGGVYLIDGGRKRPIISAGIFESRYRWNQVVGITNAQLASYHDGPRLGFRDGTLISAPNGAVFVISSQQRRPFPSGAVFNSMGYRWDAIRSASDSAVGIHPPGPTMSTGSPRRHPAGTTVRVSGQTTIWWLDGQGRRVPFTSTNLLTAQGVRSSEMVTLTREELQTYVPPSFPLPDGSLIAPPGGAVFFVSDGRKRPFPNASTFESMGYRWDAILGVSNAESAQLPTGPAMRSGTQHPNGTLVQAGGGGVYLIDGGRKRPIISAGIFESRYRWNQIVGITNAQLASYPDGPRLGFRDGTLISAPNGAVFVISNQQRRPFPSAAVFNSMGYRWDAIRSASSSQVNIHPVGPAIE